MRHRLVPSQKIERAWSDKILFIIARKKEVVGTTGFEPATSRTPSVRATRLRYVPTAAARTEPNSKRARRGPHSTSTSVSPAFEKRQESAQRVAQIEQHFAAQKFGSVLVVRRRGHHLGATSTVPAKMSASAGDGKAFVIKQALDLEDQVNIFLAVHAMPIRALNRLQHGKFAFPVAQDKRFQFGEAADFADAVKRLLGGGLRCGAVVRHS